MNERNDILGSAWTDEERVIGGLTIARPTIHRINTLIRRRNKWVADDGKEQTDIEAMCEWLFVLSRTRDELQKLFRVEHAEWCEIIDEFIAETPDATIREFQGYFEGVMESLRAGSVDEVEEPGKPEPAVGGQNHAS